jgi:hypothetical protein
MPRYQQSDYVNEYAEGADALEAALVEREVQRQKKLLESIMLQDRERKIATEAQDRQTAAGDRARRIAKEDSDNAWTTTERQKTLKDRELRPTLTYDQEDQRALTSKTKEKEMTTAADLKLQDDRQAHDVSQQTSRFSHEDSQASRAHQRQLELEREKARLEKEGKTTAGGGKLGVAAQAQVAAGDSALRLIEDLKRLHQDPEVSSRMGPIRGPLNEAGQNFGVNFGVEPGSKGKKLGFKPSKKFAEFTTKTTQLRNMTIQGRTGAQLSQHEDERITKEIAMYWDDPNIVWPEKIKAMEGLLSYMNWRKIQLASGAKKDEIDAIGLDGFMALRAQEQAASQPQGGDLSDQDVDALIDQLSR